jgi:hypothetical protein
VVASYQAVAGSGVTVDAAYVKAAIAADVTAQVKNYEQGVHKDSFTLTSFAVT